MAQYKVIFDVDEEKVTHVAPTGESLSIKEGIDLLFYFMQMGDMAKLVRYDKVDEEDTIEISWSIEDVKEIASDLTDAQCRDVLRLTKFKHDATIGVSWDTLEMWADVVRRGEYE